MADVKLIKPRRIIDGTSGKEIMDSVILLKGPRIEAVCPEEDLPPIGDAEVIDADELTAIPGMIDCHVHLCLDGDDNPNAQTASDTAGMVVLRCLRNARRHLEAGVTTVRDLGAKNFGVIDVRNAIDSGMFPGPRILTAGKLITMTGGHGHFMADEWDGVDGVMKAARLNLKNGADLLKFMSTGGVMTPGTNPGATQLSPEEIAVIIREAHNAGKKTATHAIGREGIRNAVLAGVDTIEHGTYMDQETMEEMRVRGTFHVPTLLALEQAVVRFEDLPEFMRTKVDKIRDLPYETFRRSHEAGVRVAAGTDGGSFFNPHGGLAGEVALMVRSGLSHMAAIKAATSGAAEALGIEQKVGTIEPGKVADIILVDGNPLKDLSALERISRVIGNGKLVN